MQLGGRSLHGLGYRTYVTTAACAFAMTAAEMRDPIAILELGLELCGAYQTRRTGVPAKYQVDPLACTADLRDFVLANPSLHGSRKVARALRYLKDGSESPRETQQALVLGLPLMQGGYGLGVPHMNFEVAASPTARALTGKSSFRCDLCWPDKKLDVEYQSKEKHSGEENRIRDSRRTSALVSMGWTVVPVTGSDLGSLAATDAIAETIREHLGKRTRVRVSDYHARKLALRRRLGLPVGYDWCDWYA